MAGEFVPEIWSHKIFLRLRILLVAMAITNQNWEGDIQAEGDTVNITTPGSVTSKPFTEGVDIDAPEIPLDTTTQLLIDQVDYFNFGVNDLLAVQTAAKTRMNDYADEATYALRDTIDNYVFSLYTGVPAGNTVNPIGTGVLVTIANIYDFFNEASRILDDNNVPQEGRFMTVSPKIKEVMKAYFADRSTAFGDTVSANGSIGNFAGFEIFMSNNVPLVVESLTGAGNQNVYKCLGGVRSGITFANQVPKKTMFAYVPEGRFQNAVKGQSIYGAKMMNAGLRNILFNAAVD